MQPIDNRGVVWYYVDMGDNITWRNERRKLSQLQSWDLNPKRLSDKQGEGLRVSIDKFGFAVPLLVSPDGEIYDGHQRKTILELMDEYGPDAEVDVRISSRPLTFDERRELVVRLKQNQADWDFDALGNIYEPEELEDWGFEEWQLENTFVPDFEPVSEDEQPRLDQKSPIKCPHCGMEFIPE